MERKKSNIGTWYRLGFAALAVIGCLMLAAGVSFARYRTDTVGGLAIQTQGTSYVYLGGVFNNAFTEGAGNWSVNDEGKMQLAFMLSNQGATAETAAPGDQEVYLRVLVSEGIGNETLQLILTTPEGENVMGEPVPIEKTTPLYTQFGPGWIYYFRDATTREELTWKLKGGQRSEVSMTLTANYETMPDTSLIQLQATGRPAND